MVLISFGAGVGIGWWHGSSSSSCGNDSSSIVGSTECSCPPSPLPYSPCPPSPPICSPCIECTSCPPVISCPTLAPFTMTPSAITTPTTSSNSPQSDNNSSYLKFVIPSPAEDAEYFGRAMAWQEWNGVYYLAVGWFNTTSRHNQVSVYKIKQQTDYTDEPSLTMELQADIRVPSSSSSPSSSSPVPTMAMSMTLGVLAFTEQNVLYIFQQGDEFDNFQWTMVGHSIHLGLDDGTKIARVSVGVYTNNWIMVQAASLDGQAGFLRMYRRDQGTQSFQEFSGFNRQSLPNYRGQLVTDNSITRFAVTTRSSSNDDDDDNDDLETTNGQVRVMSWGGPSMDMGAPISTQVADYAKMTASNPFLVEGIHGIALDETKQMVAVSSGTGLVHVYLLRNTGWILLGGKPLRHPEHNDDCPLLSQGFGQSIAFVRDGTDLWVGAPLMTVDGAAASSCNGTPHAANVFRFQYNITSEAWIQVASFAAADDDDMNGAGSSFGATLATNSENLVAIGSPGNGQNPVSSKVLVMAVYW